MHFPRSLLLLQARVDRYVQIIHFPPKLSLHIAQANERGREREKKEREKVSKKYQSKQQQPCFFSFAPAACNDEEESATQRIHPGFALLGFPPIIKSIFSQFSIRAGAEFCILSAHFS
jgi:hypothetical protein